MNRDIQRLMRAVQRGYDRTSTRMLSGSESEAIAREVIKELVIITEAGSDQGTMHDMQVSRYGTLALKRILRP